MKGKLSVWLRSCGIGLLLLVATASVYGYVTIMQAQAWLQNWARGNPQGGSSDAPVDVVLHDTYVVVASPSVLALGGVLLLMGLVFTVFPKAVAGLFGKR